jgi:hypothetical protein
MLLFVTLIWLASSPAVPQNPAPDCATQDACRAQALIAEAAGDFERFHDLAWRAVQKGTPNNPELMTMLARAMALSGRPGDAIVMLSRLADMGVKVDTSGDEFRVVRTLKDWPGIESKFAALSGPLVTDAVPPAAAPAPPVAPRSPARERPAKTVKEAPKAATRAPGAAPAPEPKPAPDSPTAEAASPPTEDSIEELSFAAPASETSGLAYDAVSRRFLVSDRTAGRLMVIDEVSHHVVPLVSTAGAGFYDELTGFRIDPRRGDLWVVSARATGDRAESVLHKLQLVSGRPIFEIQPTSFGALRLVDVAVDAAGTVYVLDAAGSRIFRLRAGSRDLELVARTKIDAPAAFDLEDDRAAIVAGADGLTRVDLASGRATHLEAKAALDSIKAVNVLGRSVFLLRQTSGGGQLVSCQLDGTGRAIRRTSVVGAASAIGRSGDKLYYVASAGVIKSIHQQP